MFARDGWMERQWRGGGGPRAVALLAVLLFTNSAVARAESFFLLPQCRIVDTRGAQGPAFSANERRTWQLGGTCGVPTTAKAVLLTVTAINATGQGYLALYPGDLAPSGTSVLNFQAGETLSNNAFVELATNGAGTLGALVGGTSTNLAIDVVGYASTDEVPPNGLTVGPLGFESLAGCRLADTRLEGGPLYPGENRLFAVRGRCGVPLDAPAALLNLTVTGVTASGHLRVHAADAPTPPTSAIILRPGLTIANGLETPLGGAVGQDLMVEDWFAGSNLTIDAHGYFVADNYTRVRPVTSCRIFDSRSTANPWTNGQTRTLNALGCDGFTLAKASAAFVNITAVGSTSAGTLTVSLPGAEVLPSTADISFAAGEPALAHGTFVPLDAAGNFALSGSLAPGGAVHVIVDVFAYVETSDLGHSGRSAIQGDNGMNPAVERGFLPGKLYSSEGLSSVNLFNGNLSVNIPIGGGYPVGGGLSYGFHLAYNSKLWDHRMHIVSVGGSVGSTLSYNETDPNRLSNAGIGWFFSLGGRLLSPDDDENNSGGPLNDSHVREPEARWVYVSPDGAEHVFYPRLNFYPTSANDDTILYSRDGSYIRLRSYGGIRDVELPDGSIYRFELKDVPTTAGGTVQKWALTQIRNRFNDNWVTVTYSRSGNQLKWQVDDSLGRSQVAYFQPDPSGFLPFGRLSELRLTASGNRTAIWYFNYSETQLWRCQNQWPFDNPQMTLPFSLLTSIDLPEGLSYGMAYNSSSAATCDSGGGLLRRLTPPTAGAAANCNGTNSTCAGTEWTYQQYTVSKAPCDSRVPFVHTPGVKERKLYDSAGGSASTWSYQPARTTRAINTVICDGDPGHPNHYGDEFHVTYTNTVTTPLGDKEINYFTDFPRQTAGDFHAQNDTDDNWADQALPLDRHFKIDAGDGSNLYLSREIQDCVSGGGCSTMAREYVRYEYDGSLYGMQALNDGYDLQRRRQVSRTVYNDGGGQHYVETVNSDFDGLGHYRTTDSRGSGWAKAGSARTTTVNYNPDSGTYDAANSGQSWVPWPSYQPWVLNAYKSKSTSEGVNAGDGKPGIEMEEDCFDGQTGFLKRRRLLKNPGDPAHPENAHDVVEVYEADPRSAILTRRGASRMRAAVRKETHASAIPAPRPRTRRVLTLAAALAGPALRCANAAFRPGRGSRTCSTRRSRALSWGASCSRRCATSCSTSTTSSTSCRSSPRATRGRRTARR